MEIQGHPRAHVPDADILQQHEREGEAGTEASQEGDIHLRHLQARPGQVWHDCAGGADDFAHAQARL